jgi:hypothetical protein
MSLKTDYKLMKILEEDYAHTGDPEDFLQAALEDQESVFVDWANTILETSGWEQMKAQAHLGGMLVDCIKEYQNLRLEILTKRFNEALCEPSRKQMESEWNRDLLAENFGFETNKHLNALTIFPKS